MASEVNPQKGEHPAMMVFKLKGKIILGRILTVGKNLTCFNGGILSMILSQKKENDHLTAGESLMAGQ